MTDRRSVGDLLREWGKSPTAVEDEPALRERRVRLVSHIAREIRQSALRRQRRARSLRVAACLAVAAVVALVAGGLLAPSKRQEAPTAVLASFRPSTAGVLLGRPDRSQAALVGVDYRLEAGDQVSTVSDARGLLRLKSGVTIGVAPSTRVGLVEITTSRELVELTVGEVTVRVPPLGRDELFSVKTPDAEVTVHGTEFRVRVHRAGDRTITEVDVQEGRVSVRRGDGEVLLLGGQRWSSEEAASGKSSAEETKPAPAPTTSAAAAPSSKVGATQKRAATDPSALAEQNELFAAAAAARARGDDRAALGSLNQLLTRYPTSPLAPEARVERFRALKRLGKDDEAAREARRYLLEQREGAARDEARDVALGKK